jgi:hypothetical protein
MHKKTLAFVAVLSGWFALIAQYVLIIENKTASIPETSIRFFSYFTILTNLLVACYFSIQLFSGFSSAKISKPGVLTALTVYITVVGLVYQFILRPLWAPQGLQKVVDELLHSFIPLLVIIYWYYNENKQATQYRQIPRWFIYPVVYLIYALLRGNISGFYPYPFIDVSKIGMQQVLINAGFLLLFFAGLSALFIAVGKVLKK